MKVILKQARIICTGSPQHGKVQDILVVNGLIEKITDQITAEADQTIQSANLHVSLGFTDIFCHFTDPGFEHRETLESGAAAAAAGGYTDLFVLPNTNPPVSAKSQVEYICRKSMQLPVNIHPIGAVTKNAEGKELAEMYDMYASGARLFSDGIQPIQHPGVLLKGLQYVLSKEALLIQLPDDKALSPHGLMNEGIVSTRLGLPGKPAIAEELMISRDIELLKYTGSKLHITGVSTRKGIEMILAAKAAGLNISFSVTPYHAYFCDEDLAGYDTNLKVNPPLRTREDMLAVRNAITEGLADCIASHHIPQHWDDKTCEFEYAKNGMAGLESLFGVVNSFSPDINILVKLLAENPRRITGLTMPEIKAGNKACLTVFDPTLSYTFTEAMIRSRSRNYGFIGKELKGRILGMINGDKITIN